ncbi:MAG: adenylate/guanylate cyclase domain-containing protein [Oscillatoria sp. PMC 1051.18]|nr:adenylate/guanylate cyclase domain-containing protein [Oscillatoria sp. PMC 1050.18]MEC5029437.1 adenylate/guanylate cyclase domain-containing protein [Oscillatoria sp. PMC 1051.18]
MQLKKTNPKSGFTQNPPLKVYNRQVPLRLVLVVPFILQIFAAVGLTGWFSLRNGQKAIQEVLTQLSNDTAVKIDQHVQNYFKIPHLVLQINAQAIRNGDLNINDFQSLQRIFYSQIHLDESVDNVYIGIENGNFVSVQQLPSGKTVLKIKTNYTGENRLIYNLDERGNAIEFVEEIEYDPRGRPWYQAAKSLGKPTWSPIYPSHYLGVLQITPVVPVYTPDNEFRGVLAANLILSQISEFLNDLEIGDSGEAFIIERTGELVASSTEEQYAIDTPEGEKRLLATDSQSELIRSTMANLLQEFDDLNQLQAKNNFHYKSEGNRYWVQVTPLRDRYGLDWLTVVVVPQADFMEKINQNTRMTILLCLAALSLATLSGLLTSGWITKPILNLSQASSAITNGKLTQKVTPGKITELAILADSFNQMAEQIHYYFTALERANQELEHKVEQRTAELRLEKEKSEKLLLNILPKVIAERLKKNNDTIAEHYEEVTILFADIVGFTPLSARLKAIELVNLLNVIFSGFDELAELLELEKIKTIGDAYMVAAGLPNPRADHAEAIADMALAMQAVVDQIQFEQGEKFQIRIGIHTGVVVAGVIGIKKFIYDMWGDTVNVASRMESSGVPGKIQVTAEVYEVLKELYVFEERGLIPVKGKGEMQTYWLIERKI